MPRPVKSLAWFFRMTPHPKSHGNQAFHKYPAVFLSLCVRQADTCESSNLHWGHLGDNLYENKRWVWVFFDFIFSLQCGMRKLHWVKQWVLKVWSRTSTVYMMHLETCWKCSSQASPQTYWISPLHVGLCFNKFLRWLWPTLKFMNFQVCSVWMRWGKLRT